MVVQVWAVAPPPAGQDWTFKVPGQFLPYLYGVTATLGTTSHVTTIPDETGHGHDATVSATTRALAGEPGPYSGGANNYSVFCQGLNTGDNNPYASSGVSAAFNLPSGTLECWSFLPAVAAGTNNANGFCLLDNGAAAIRVGTGTLDNTHTPADTTIVSNGAFRFNDLATFTRDTWHHLALTWDAVNFRSYVDAALVSTHAGQQPLMTNTNKANVGSTQIGGQLRGYQAACAIYGAALGAANFSAHMVAASSWANYRAAVLADSPVALWGLNTIPTLANRIATLQVTDGTFVVAQFPANFAAATASGFIWSWQVGGPGAAASTDGITNSVPIPELRVDPGYTVGVKTLDLQSTDQWGPITLWFDDGTGPGGPGGPGGLGNVGYLDGTLTPQYGRA